MGPGARSRCPAPFRVRPPRAALRYHQGRSHERRPTQPQRPHDPAGTKRAGRHRARAGLEEHHQPGPAPGGARRRTVGVARRARRRRHAGLRRRASRSGLRRGRGCGRRLARAGRRRPDPSRRGRHLLRRGRHRGDGFCSRPAPPARDATGWMLHLSCGAGRWRSSSRRCAPRGRGPSRGTPSTSRSRWRLVALRAAACGCPAAPQASSSPPCSCRRRSGARRSS